MVISVLCAGKARVKTVAEEAISGLRSPVFEEFGTGASELSLSLSLSLSLLHSVLVSVKVSAGKTPWMRIYNGVQTIERAHSCWSDGDSNPDSLG